MDEEKNSEQEEETEPVPVYQKKIRKTTYVVKVHFSETARETMEQKIQRMLRTEAEQNVNNF